MSEKPQPDSAVTRLAVAGIGAVVSSILFSAYMLFPPAGFIFGLLAPFPAMVLRFRNAWGTAVTATLLTTTLLAGVFGVQAGLLYLVQCGVIALLLPELLIRGYGAARSIAWTTSVNLVVYLLAALAIFFISGRSVHQLHDLAVSEITASISQALAIYERAGIKGDELVAVKMAMTTAANLVIRIYPALATVILIVMSGCNLVLIKRFSLHLGIELKIDEFRDFRNPDLMIWFLIVAGFAILTDVSMVTTPALNILAVLGVLYFLQGMAVISSMIFRLNSSMVLKVALYLLLFAQPYVAALVAVIGIFDLWGDFRTPRKQENL
jgi:hypothetical protein